MPREAAPDSLEREVERAADRLRAASSVVVFTGAGISAESGLPTFRSGANAMWKDVDVSRYATPGGYRAHAPDSWRWYAMRARMAASVAPNAGHAAIAAIERRAEEFLLVTQNVDGLHQRAGSREVVELHGSLRARCFDCSASGEWPASDAPDPRDSACARCGGLLRPDVVFFEEFLPAEAMQRACETAERCDLLLAVGTSHMVWPAAAIPELALAGGANVVIVNPDMSGQMRGERVTCLAGLAGVILPRLVALAYQGS